MYAKCDVQAGQAQHQRNGSDLGRSAPSLTSGLWYSRPGLEWICIQHCSQ